MVMVAPFDGVIVSGDLSQSLGTPVERGQVLFEVAPLDGYRIALQVDERDFAHVAAASVASCAVRRCRASALVHRQQVTPVNTAGKGAITSGSRRFSTAARGAAATRHGGLGKIHVEERKLVWIWTRSFVDWVRLWLWSWLP